MSISLNLLPKGAFNIYVNRILTLLDHPPTHSKQTQKIEKGDLPYKHKHLTDHLPTSSCLRSYWMRLKTPQILSIPFVTLKGTNIVQLLGLLSCTACRLVSSNSVGFFARNCGLVTLGKMFMWEASSRQQLDTMPIEIIPCKKSMEQLFLTIWQPALIFVWFT